MRKTAITLAVLGLLALIPPTIQADDCRMDTGEGVVCMALPVDEPTPPSGLPGAPPEADPYFGRYYLYVGVGDCAESAISNGCRGVPPSPGSGVPLPTGGAAGAGVFGMVYEESNNLPGLQRFPTFLNGLRAADHMVLV